MGAIASKNGSQKDLVLIADGQKFSVDKSVIALHSCVFAKMLELGPTITQLNIEDIDELSMREIIRYMYDRDTSGLDTADTIIRVLIAAKTYAMQELASIATAKLTTIITNDNAIFVIKLAIHYDNPEITMLIVNIIVRNGLSIVKSNEMNELYETHSEIAPMFVKCLFEHSERNVSPPIEIPARKRSY